MLQTKTQKKEEFVKQQIEKIKAAQEHRIELHAVFENNENKEIKVIDTANNNGEQPTQNQDSVNKVNGMYLEFSNLKYTVGDNLVLLKDVNGFVRPGDLCMFIYFFLCVLCFSFCEIAKCQFF